MGAKETPTTTQTNEVQLSPAQKELEALLIPQAKIAAGTDYAAYGGPTVAGFTPNEVAGQQGVVGAAQGGITDLANAGNKAQQFMLDPSMLNPETNPFLKAQGDAVAGSISRNFTQNIMPSLRSGDTLASGMYSGGNTKAGQTQGLAAGATSQASADALTDLYFKSYQQGLGTMQNAVQNNPSVIAANLVAPTALGAVGQQQRSMDQANMDAKAQQYYFNQFAPMLKTQDLASIIGSLPGGKGVSTVQGAKPQGGGIKGALGGAASGAAIGSVVPVIGTGIGAALGGLAGYFS